MTEYSRIEQDSEKPLEQELEQEVSLSRRRARRGKQKGTAPVVNREFYNQQPKVEVKQALLWSALISLISVANPLLSSWASNIQSQNLYAGFAMQAGQSPYGDFFGTNGVLYYLLTALGTSFGTSVGLVLLQFAALLIAGIYFYKIVLYFSRSHQTANNLSFWFYLFILALAFGGVYASIFALPLLLTSLWFLVRYFENAVRDEAFILYGIDAALVFLIYPKSLILWLMASLVLFVYTIRNHQLARGIYRWLATLFGFLLIIYLVGYYTFIEQTLGLAIQQTFLYNISLDFSYTGILWTLLIVFGVLVVTGFFKGLIETLTTVGNGKHSYLKAVVLLTFLVQTLFIIGNPNFELNQLTILLPIGFMMVVLNHSVTSVALDEEDEEDEGQLRVRYLSANFYLPLIACLAILLQPLYTYFAHGEANQERQVLAEYIQANSEDADLVYAWDDSAQIYLLSDRLSSARIITAEPYLNTSANTNNLLYDLNKSQARYIVVNIKLAMLDEVKAILDSQYSLVDTGTTDTLLLYQKNE